MSCGVYQGVGKLGVDAPVACLVGVGQGAAGHCAAQAHMIEFVALGAQAGFDIAQTFAMGELRKGHTSILVLTTEPLDVTMAMVALNTATQGMVRNPVEREHSFWLNVNTDSGSS